jgi:CheY-like chemotaxis protein
MATQSLLLCRDPDVLGVLRSALAGAGLGAEVCDGPESALALLQEGVFNPVIVDCDQLDAGGEVLRWLRQSQTHRDAIALGIVGDDSQVRGIYDSGANFVLRKPLSLEEANRTLRTARSLVKRMRRRFLRCVVHTLAYARLDGVRDEPMILDIGEGGLAIQCLEPLELRRAFALRFHLPGEREEFEAVAAVAWSDASGRSGLRFLGMPPAARERLGAWLERSGATGPAEVPLSPEEASDRVRLPLQLSPLAHAIGGALVDIGVIACAVAAFALVTWIIADELPLRGALWSALLLLGCGCWLVYRYLFFGAVAMTPGGHIAAALADRCLAWSYNRRQPAAAD